MSTKPFRSRFTLICVIIATVLVLVPSALSIFGYTDLLRSGLKTVAKPFELGASKLAEALDGFVSVFTEYDKLQQENQELREELSALEEQQEQNEILKEENAWLRDYLSLSAAHPEYLLTDATVIARQASNYATVLTLNRGTAHGVRRNMPVLTAEGVFGYVSEAGLDWCKVVSIIETASAVSAYTERGQASGVVEGDAALREDGMCLLKYVEADADIRVGDSVYTGGNGTVYPPGLLIGRITAIEADEYSRTLVAYIEPAIDFSDTAAIKRVMVITGYAGSGGGT